MFATVMCLVLPMCILIRCSAVLIAVGMFVCEIYVVLDQCDESPSLFVCSVCAYCGVFFVF